MAEGEWHYALGDQPKDPVSLQGLHDLIRNGTLTRQDRVWTPGMSQWIAAGDLPALAGVFAGEVPPPMPLAASAVTTNSPCRKCGYNLHGLQTDGRCPECGTFVGLSVLGDLLRFSEPAFVRQLARGMGMLLLGTYLGFAVGFVGGVLIAIHIRGGFVVIILANLIGSALTLIGAYLFTAPDPSGIGEDKYGLVRKIVRVTLAINLANTLFGGLPQLIVLPLPLHQLVVSAQVICGIASVVGYWAQLDYLAGLAGRLPDENIVSSAKMLRTWLTTVFGIVYLLGAATSLAQVFGNAGPGSGLFMGLGCSAALVGVAALVFLIMYLIMLHKFRRQLLHQAAIARAAWSTTSSPTPAQNKAADQPAAEPK